MKLGYKVHPDIANWLLSGAPRIYDKSDLSLNRSGFQHILFFLAAAWVNRGRNALQSAEQRCQRRYGPAFNTFKFLLSWCATSATNSVFSRSVTSLTLTVPISPRLDTAAAEYRQAKRQKVAVARLPHPTAGSFSTPAVPAPPATAPNTPNTAKGKDEFGKGKGGKIKTTSMARVKAR